MDCAVLDGDVGGEGEAFDCDANTVEATQESRATWRMVPEGDVVDHARAVNVKDARRTLTATRGAIVAAVDHQIADVHTRSLNIDLISNAARRHGDYRHVTAVHVHSPESQGV